MALLSDRDRHDIEDAVRRMERESATEFVVAVLRSSGDYRFGRALGGFAWAIAGALLSLWLWPDLDPVVIVLAELPFALLVYVLFGLPPLARALLTPEAASRAVSERAFALFTANGLHRTRDRTGMLILVSELEHRVVILGDAGIHEHVGDAGWQSHVEHILASIARREAARGIIDVIERLGALHAEHLPPRPDDANELPDSLVRG